MTMRTIQYGGTILIGLLDANRNLVSGIRTLANVWPMTINISTETKTKKSAMKETHGQTLNTKTSITETTGGLTANDYDVETVNLALNGEKILLAGTGGTVTDEEVTLISGEWVRLVNVGGGVSSVVITGSVVDVDYKVNEKLGLVFMIPGGNLTPGATNVSYSYAAESGYQIKIAKNAQTRVLMLLDGIDVETGESITGEFYSVVMSSDGDFTLIHDPDADMGEISLSLVFETPDGKDCPGVLNSLQLHQY